MQQYMETVEGRNLTVQEINDTIATNGTTIDDTAGSGRTFIRIDALKSLNTFDTTIPEMVNPNTTATKLFAYNSIHFIANVTDVNLQSIWLESNHTGSLVNYSMTNKTDDQYNYTLTNNTFSAGTFQFRIHSNDTGSNVNCSNWFNLTVLTGAPQITLHGPANNTITNNATVVFNFSAIEDVDPTFNCSVNSILNQTNFDTANNTVTEFIATFVDGTHNWNIICNDTDSLTANSSLREFTIDTTAPSFNLESFNTPIELGDNLSYSINVTDAYLNFSHNGENRTMTNSSSNYSINFITLVNNTNSFTVYALDNAGNINQTNNTFRVQDTITGPRVVNIHSTSSLDEGSEQYISAFIVDAADISDALIDVAGSNISMSNNTAYNFSHNFTTSGCSTKTFTISSSDSSNNENINSSTYTLTLCCGDNSCNNGESCSSCSADCGECSDSSSSSSGGGGGGGGGGSGSSTSSTTSSTEETEEEEEEPDTIVTRTIETASPEEPISLDLGSASIPFKELEIIVNNDLLDIEITVELLDTKPSSVETPAETIIYKYLDISVNFDDEDIDEANIDFSVPSTWISQNNIDKETVILLHYTNGAWEELETTFIEEKDNEYLYEATTSSFSYFAITAEEKVIETQTLEEITGDDTLQTAPTEDDDTTRNLLFTSILIVLSAIILLIFLKWTKR